MVDGPAGGFGVVLRAQRLRAGLTQQQVSQQAGVSLRTLRDIEAGRVQAPRAASVRQLARAVGLDPTKALASARAPVPARRGVAHPDATGWELGVLGPLLLRRDGQVVEIGSRMQRLVLGLLALQPGRVVGAEELIDVLWGEHPPATYRNLLHTHITRLRRLLAPSSTPPEGRGVIVAAGDGYQLAAGRIDLDVARFERLADQARQARAVDAGLALDLLQQATGTWRGPVLADLAGSLARHPAAVALAQRRVDVVTELADLAVQLGRPKRAVGPLRVVAHAEPLHEEVHARLLLALAGCGQQAAALNLYAELRSRLADELGVEPGPELQAAHLRVLHGDLTPAQPAGRSLAPSVEAPPAQLPADLAGFTGREAHLRQLDALLPADGGPAPGVVLITAVSGMAGVGKTALAIHWAHPAASHFGDGQLYVNLSAHGPDKPLEPLRALTVLLVGLGVAPERVPVELEAAAGLYRSLLAGRRMLVVLDNARDAAQVRPLLPGSPGCVVVVTSRDQLAGLVATHGVRRLALDVLTPAEATALLREVLGVDRVAAEPDAAAELARLCGHLPLALRVAAAALAARPDQPIAGYVAGLRGRDRLAQLAVDGDPQTAVQVAFDHSYQRLDHDSRRVFRLLGLVPGADVSVPAAAALAGVEPAAAVRLLHRLAGAHLVMPRGQDRFTLHDLLRLYAWQRAQQDEDSAERDAAAGRLLDWYLGAANAAVTLLHPELLRLPVPARHADAARPPMRFGQPAAAMAWLEAERPNLIAAIQHAAAHGHTSRALLLADALHAYFELRNYTAEWLLVADSGLRAAVALGDLRGQATSRLSLGGAHQAAGRFSDAAQQFTQALALAGRAGWLDGRSEALSRLGLLQWWSGNLQAAAEHSTSALALAQQTGRLTGQTTAHLRIALVNLHQGRLQEAADHQTQALTLFRQLGLKSGEAHALATLSISTHELGRLDDAHEHASRSLDLMRELGDRFGESYTLRALAAVHGDAGRHRQALETARAAVGLAGEIGHRYVEATAHNTLASIHLLLSQRESAHDHYQQARMLARQTASRAQEATALLGLAAVGLRTGRPRQAIDHARHALEIATQCGMRVHEGHAHAHLAAAYRDLGHHDQARTHARRALALHEQTGHRLGQARTLQLLATLQPDGDDQETATLLKEARVLLADIGSPEHDQPA